MTALTAVALAALAVALAEPVSRWLAAARWPHRAPRAALVLWQAVGLAAGLAATGAGVVYAVTPLGGTLPDGLSVLWRNARVLRPFDGMDVPHAVALVGAAVLAARLAGVLVAVGTATLLQRRRHRRLVDLVGTPSPRLAGTVVLDHPAAVAYCLPGLRPRIVLSAGTLALLDEDHLDGVMSHERAHLGARHDLVVLPFVAWAAALPFVPGVRRARAAVATLVEMLADDHARHRCGPQRLAAAIAALGGAGAPAGALALGGSPVLARVERLLDPPAPAGAALRAAVYAAAVLLVGVPTAVLLLPGL
jgi:Zn-dependent protease with chaperone function